MTTGSSGLDLYSTASVSVSDKKQVVVGTGICVRIPSGYEGHVRPRSGLFSEYGVLTLFGTIDNDYRGEIRVGLYCVHCESVEIPIGTRIAQLVISPVAFPDILVVDKLSDTDRGDGGFGHTGY